MGVVLPEQYDISLSEFTYTMVRNSPLSAKRHLPEKLFKRINTEAGAMKFAAKSTLAEKMEFFSYIGLQTFLVIADVKKGQAVNDFRQLFSEYESKEKPISTLKRLSDNNTFITSSKEFIYRLGQMAQLVDTKPYARSQELVRASYHANGFRSKLSVNDHADPSREMDDSVNLIKFLGKTLWVNNLCKELTGVDSPAIQLLIFLYCNRHSYFSRQKLIDELGGSLSGKQLATSRRILLENHLVQKEYKENSNSITITAKGILVVNQFRDKVIKMLDF